MNSSDETAESQSLRTRGSLIDRLRRREDEDCWRDFYSLYGKLVRGLAIKCGLTEHEADEATHETMVTVSKMLDDYQYDRKRCSFRSWIFHKARWRIADQLRKRPPVATSAAIVSPDPDRTATIERLADPNSDNLSDLWEEEWRQDLARRAMDSVKAQVSARQFQIFDLYVIRGLPASEVIRILDASRMQLYLAKHRITRLLQKETARLEAELG